VKVHLYVEGELEEPVARKIIREAGLRVSGLENKRGKVPFMRDLPALMETVTANQPCFALRDLDLDAPCAGVFLERNRFAKQSGLVFRLAIRETEAWLMADRAAFSAFLGVEEGDVPATPEKLDEPKEEIVRLAKTLKAGPRRNALVPRLGSGRIVGPDYTATLADFARGDWSPKRSARRSPSLRATLNRLNEL
jgi:hypothetical protein